MPIFNVKLEEMTPQRTRTGRVRTDANGQPLCSVQIIQSPEQKLEMMTLMQNISRIYKQIPELFLEGAYQIGVDPKSYTVAEMITDLDDRFRGWRTSSRNHIYKSFVDRHNWMVEHMQELLWHLEMFDEISEVKEQFTITLNLPQHDRIRQTLINSPLFDLKE